MEKRVQDADTIAHKLWPASTKATNLKLEVAKEEMQKKEKMVKKRKAEETMTVKQRKARGRISLSSEKKRNYKGETKDKTDLNQVNDEYSLQLWKAIGYRRQKWFIYLFYS